MIISCQHYQRLREERERKLREERERKLEEEKKGKLEEKLEEEIKKLKKELKETKKLKGALKETEGKVLGRDVVLFYGHLLVKPEYDALSEFVQSYCCSDIEEISLKKRKSHSRLRLDYTTGYGPIFFLEIEDQHIVKLKLHCGRLGRHFLDRYGEKYRSYMPNFREEDKKDLKKKLPRLEERVF